MLTNLSQSFLALFMGIALTACASNLSENTYERGEIGEVSRVDKGRVVSSRAIVINGNKPYIGAATGAVVGAAAGNMVEGGDEEKLLATIGAALVGAAAGAAIEKGTTRQRGYSYTIELESGKIVTVAQGGEDRIADGAPVFIEYGDRARVIRQYTYR